MVGLMEEKIKKVLIMGLDNSGKTSIVLCLKGVKNLLSFYSLNPTKGISINKFRALDSNFNIWDFGGQEQFRGEYLKNFNKHIVGTKKIIYVVDVQDIERYDISLDYLKNIVNLLMKEKNNVEFSIFLHKFDPDIETTNKEINREVLHNLINSIKNAIPLDFDFTIHKSSIYTVFQKSSID